MSWGAADYSLALAGNLHLHNAARAAFRVAAPLCFGSATALADSINLSEVTANTTVADGTTLTGTLGENVKISMRRRVGFLCAMRNLWYNNTS